MFAKKFILISLFVFNYIIAFPIFAFEKGLLWQIESPTGAKSKIFGTNHLVDNDIDLIFNIITKEILKSQVVFIEYILDEKDHPFISKNLINTKKSIENRISKSELNHLKKFMSDHNIAFDSLKNSAPFLIYSYLINPGSMHSLQMDFKIADLATENNIFVKGLEDSQAVLENFLQFDDSFYLLALKERLLNIETLSSYRKNLKALYFNQNLNDMLASLNEKEISPQVNSHYLNSIIHERNLNMFNSARADLDKGGVFIAVGAAHLGGEKGLLNLLKKAGYKITNQDLALRTDGANGQHGSHGENGRDAD